MGEGSIAKAIPPSPRFFSDMTNSDAGVTKYRGSGCGEGGLVRATACLKESDFKSLRGLSVDLTYLL